MGASICRQLAAAVFRTTPAFNAETASPALSALLRTGSVFSATHPSNDTQTSLLAGVRPLDFPPKPDGWDAAAEVWALVERAQAGDSAAFGLIYDRYVDTVFRFVYFRVGNSRLAEDLTADTFLRALRRIGSFTWQGRDLDAWLVTIARHLVADQFASGRYRLEVTTGDVLDAARTDCGAEGSAEAAVVDHVTNVAVLTAVRQLNPEQQECIVLRFLQGFSIAETAQAMGKNEGAIKALQYRALQTVAYLLPGVSRPLHVFRRQRAERLKQLLDEAGGARRHHVHSRVDGELGPLLAVSDRIARLEQHVEVEPDFRAGLRAMLVATGEREGIGATAGPPVNPARTTSRHLTGPADRRARARGAVIVGIVAGTLALSGMSAASGDAVPGDALYGVKRSTERAQLALAGSDLSRGQLYLEFAKTRVNEARAVRVDSARLALLLTDMDAETTQGVRFLNTAAVNRRDPVALDAVDRFVEVQRRSVAALLDGQPAGHERILDSLTLLDAVTKRTSALRTSLTCGVASNDPLGPIPKTCGGAPPPANKSPSTVPSN